MGRVTSVRPLWGIEGGRVTLEGDGFSIDPVAPQVRVGAQPARLASASAHRADRAHPRGARGRTRRRSASTSCPGETAFVEIGAPLVTGVHHVDSPAYDRHGNLYVTFSGSRGQQAPVSIFIVRQDGTREPFVSDVPNPTSLAFDREGRLYVSSRFDGSVYRVEADGRASLYASDLGVACGLAFGPDGALFVGDRSGLDPARRRRRPRARVRVAAGERGRVPPRVRPRRPPLRRRADARHARSRSIASRPTARPSPWSAGFGRPQGLAFDAAGHLYVVDALAGSSGLYRIRLDAPHAPELMLSGGALIGLAFDPHGGIALATSETVYRLGVPLRGLLLPAVLAPTMTRTAR